jgi:uncharacterized membrane protein YdfJ with MMPL/SSD domain
VKQQRAKPPPKETKAEHDRKLAERAVVWTRRNALIAALGVVVAAIAILVPSSRRRPGPQTSVPPPSASR